MNTNNNTNTNDALTFDNIKDKYNLKAGSVKGFFYNLSQNAAYCGSHVKHDQKVASDAWGAPGLFRQLKEVSREDFDPYLAAYFLRKSNAKYLKACLYAVELSDKVKKINLIVEICGNDVLNNKELKMLKTYDKKQYKQQ